MKFVFSGKIKNTQIKFSMEIHLLESELLHAGRGTEGRTDRHDEGNSRFSEFCERT